MLRLFMADRTFELRFHAAFKSHVPVERVWSSVGIAATRTRVIAITRGYLITVDFGQWLTVLDLLGGSVIAGTNARRILSRGCSRRCFLRHLVLRHQLKIHRLVLVVPFDGRTWRVLPL